MSTLIRELKRRLKDLEEKHRTRPLPSIVVEMEFSRKPVTMMYSSKEYKDMVEVFRGASIKGEISGNEYIVYNLPHIVFDSNTFKRIEEVAYGKFNIDKIVDVPPIPHPRYGREAAGGLELLKDGKPVATLFPSRFHININYELAEELAEALLKEVYRFEREPSLFEILIMKIKRFIRRISRGEKREGIEK